MLPLLHSSRGELTAAMPVQRKDGAYPGGLVATETQEWRKWRLFPLCQHAAELYFNSANNPQWTDFDTRCYNQLVKLVGWPERTRGKLYLVQGDSDVRHSMISHLLWRLHRQEHDRTELPANHPQYIRFWRAEQEPATAPKVPDCLQQPIELCFSHVKPEVNRIKEEFMRSERRQPTSYELADMTVRVCKAKITPKLVRSNFEHARTAIDVFKGRIGETVKYVKGAKEWTVQCTDGGWVPRIVAA